MKSFEIIDEENNLNIGILLYYEKEKAFIIELADGLDEWSAPLLFTKFVSQGIYTIPRDASLMWVKERVIPSGRQNIGAILNNHKLKSYDEMKFLELSQGRCSQDSLFIKKITELPSFVQKRNLQNLTDCVVLENSDILCFFADDSIKRIELNTLPKSPDITKVLNNDKLLASCKLGVGGYYITFNDSIDIPAHLLYKHGKRIPLNSEDFHTYIKKNLFDTSEACKELGCTRQNLSYMVNQGQIAPTKENVNGNLYTKGELEKSRW